MSLVVNLISWFSRDVEGDLEECSVDKGYWVQGSRITYGKELYLLPVHYFGKDVM